MLSTAKEANVGFSQVVQLFAPPVNLVQKILFINSEKNVTSWWCDELNGSHRQDDDCGVLRWWNRQHCWCFRGLWIVELSTFDGFVAAKCWNRLDGYRNGLDGSIILWLWNRQ